MMGQAINVSSDQESPPPNLSIIIGVVLIPSILGRQRVVFI